MNSSQEPIDGFNSKLVDFSNFFIIKKKSIIIIKKGEKERIYRYCTKRRTFESNSRNKNTISILHNNKSCFFFKVRINIPNGNKI